MVAAILRSSNWPALASARASAGPSRRVGPVSLDFWMETRARGTSKSADLGFLWGFLGSCLGADFFWELFFGFFLGTPPRLDPPMMAKRLSFWFSLSLKRGTLKRRRAHLEKQTIMETRHRTIYKPAKYSIHQNQGFPVTCPAAGS